MLCDNCGKREANVKYSENINGIKKELNLCEECSQKLGIGNMKFNMPIDFSNFFGEFLEDFANPEYMPLFNDVKTLKCNQCGYTFDDIINTGKLGCGNCYNVFEDELDNIIKKIQGTNRHVGRIGKVLENKIETSGESQTNNKQEKTDLNDNKLENLKEQLKLAVKEERYEDAAKIRDEIKKIENK